VRCRGYSKGDSHSFKGWIDSPWDKMESGETGRAHKSQVETETVSASDAVIPASSTTFYNVAFNKLKIEKEQAKEVLKKHTDLETGEVKYIDAIIALEGNLPEGERDFTNQQKGE